LTSASPRKPDASEDRGLRAKRFSRPLLALLSGLLIFLSFPKFGHGAVAWVALVPLLVALPGVTARRAAALGFFSGWVAGVGLLYWTALVVVQFGGLPLVVAVPLMFVLSAAVALFPTLFAWLVARALRRFGLLGLLVAPLGWVGTETLRTYTFFNFPWCLLGYSQYQQPVVIQIAALTAVYGVSFVLVAVSTAIAYALLTPVRRGPVLLAASAIVGLTLAFGAWHLRQVIPESGRLRVGIVQASIRQEDKWRPGLYEDNVRRHMSLTVDAAAQGARLVVWPESAVPFDYDHDPQLAAVLQKLVRSHGIYLMFGNGDRDESTRPPRVWVGAKLLTPEGELTYRYHKRQLVPFGEYVPLKPLLTLGGRFGARLVQDVGEFTPGDEYVVGEVDGHRFATQICYEAIFPELSRGFAQRGADLLVSITNDGWYGTTSAPYQHMMMATFRAVEQGKYLVRSANTGISAIVDPRGRVLEHTELFEVRTLVRDVPLVPGLTPYARVGDVFAFSCLALSVLAAFVPRGRQGAGQG
jgi:apolipoprotein N-acyltransferase